MEIPNRFYRISIKALILDETRSKFLLTQEDNGRWELPGGGIDWGETPKECVVREIKEEMGLSILSVADRPYAFLTFQFENKTRGWGANVVYEVSVENLSFIPSSECMALKFVTPEEVKHMDVFPNVVVFAKFFEERELKP